MKNTQKIALGGLLTALACVVIIVANVFPAGMYTFPAVSGLIVFFIAMTAGRSYGWISFFVVSVLSFILCTNKETSLCFILFFGFYPMLKEVIEKLKFKPVQYILKLLVFNAAAVCIYFLLIFVFSVPADDFEYFGINIPALFLIIINPVFLLYDYAITVVLRVYRQKINNFVTKMTKKF